MYRTTTLTGVVTVITRVSDLDSAQKYFTEKPNIVEDPAIQSGVVQITQIINKNDDIMTCL